MEVCSKIYFLKQVRDCDELVSSFVNYCETEFVDTMRALPGEIKD